MNKGAKMYKLYILKAKNIQFFTENECRCYFTIYKNIQKIYKKYTKNIQKYTFFFLS